MTVLLCALDHDAEHEKQAAHPLVVCTWHQRRIRRAVTETPARYAALATRLVPTGSSSLRLYVIENPVNWPSRIWFRWYRMAGKGLVPSIFHSVRNLSYEPVRASPIPGAVRRDGHVP